MRIRKFWMVFLPFALVFGLFMGGCDFGGSDGDDGAAGKSAYEIAVENGFTGTEEEWLAMITGGDGGSSAPGEGSWFGEYCVSCHADDGAFHQASYDELYQGGVIQVSDLAYASAGTTDVVTFEMTKFGNPFDCTDADALNIYFIGYTGDGTFEMAGGSRMSIKGTVTYDADTNVCESTNTASALGDLSAADGLVVVYGRDETLGRIPGTRVDQERYPFAAVQVLGTVDYASPATVTGCEKCHTKPFLKHGYILASTQPYEGSEENAYYTCKACHLDNGEGGHFMWQLLVDDPQLIITLEEEYGEDWEESGDARLAPYAYKTSVMNDVHMSHAMEFPYPQSMSNCVTCHEGKLDAILNEDNFNLTTCKSCHPMNGGTDLADDEGEYAYATTDIALSNLMPVNHGIYDETTNCAACHADIIPTLSFRAIHSGYDPVVYTADGVRYSDEITVSIDDAVLNDSSLQITVSASGSVGSLDAADIVPTVLVGLYGQATKDFLVGPHARDIDGDRNLEFDVAPGESHPRFSVIDTSVPGTWVVAADLSHWQEQIGDTIGFAEIGVIPDLGGVAINSVTRTFSLFGNDFADGTYDEIVSVEEGCNSCHEALATNFHSPGYGGDIDTCRLCHITQSGGSHLEMQSRSIDSYVHAIHNFQPFDVGRSIDFTDPVEELHYEHHIGFIYPTLGFDCESCHNEGTYDVPSQYDSMPGLLSASRDTADFGWDRNIADVPEYVTGPASRACGSCHRVPLINHDDAEGLAEFNQHVEDYGYLWENDDNDVILNFIIDSIFSVYAP